MKESEIVTALPGAGKMGGWRTKENRSKDGVVISMSARKGIMDLYRPPKRLFWDGTYLDCTVFLPFQVDRCK